MKKIISLVMVLVITSLVTGTILEKIYGTAFAAAHIYHSVWFMCLLGVVAILSLFFLIQKKLYLRWTTCLMHAAMLFIIAGIIVTTFTSQSGTLEVSECAPASTFTAQDSTVYQLPFSVELKNFEVSYYPGTRTPQDYTSEIVFHSKDGTAQEAHISMNNIAKHKGYRFYQAGYVQSEKVLLTVAHDPSGITLTYIGYALLFLSFIVFFFDKQSRFKELLAKVPRQAAMVMLIALPLVASVMPSYAAEGAKPRTLPKESAQQMGKLYVYYNDRVCPLNTLAKDFTTKLYGAPTYKGLTSEQVFSGWIFYFTDWRKEPMFKIKGDVVRKTLGIDGKYASFADFTDPIGKYRLETALDTMGFRNPLRSKFLAADEKYNLILMLYGGELLKIFPVSDSTGALSWCSQSDPLPLSLDENEYIFIRQHMSYSQELVLTRDFAMFNTLMQKTHDYQMQKAKDSLPSAFKTKMEILYNKITVGRFMAMLCIMIGLLFFAYALVCFGGKRPYSRWMKMLGVVLLCLLSAYLLCLFVVRWCVAGHIPMSNGYETMLFLALCMAILGLLFSRRHPIFVSGGLLLAGFALLVAMMGGANPSVTHLMPVLASPLLCMHVAVIMTAYALLAFIMLNGLAALGLAGGSKLLRKSPVDEALERLQLISQLMLYPAVFLLAIGIFIGAVWANVSWGTYWSWDPKEVWALITLLVYALPLHDRIVTQFNKPLFFHCYMVVAFLSVLFTYFGVNFFLGGLHSYA